MEETSIENNGIKAKLTKKNIAIILLIIAIVMASWYFLYWKKTPAYSLGLIRESIEKHDVVAFEKHVDMDSLLSHAFDDIIMASLNDDKSTNDVGKTFALGFAQVIKQPFIMTMKDAGKRFVEKGNIDDSVDNKPDKSAAKISPKELSKKTGVASSEFKGIAYTKKDGKIAVIGIKIHEKQINKDMVLDLKMNELEDGTWRLSEISNLKNYMADLEKSRKEKLAELNKPLDEQIKSIMVPGNIVGRVSTTDPWGFSSKLFITIPFSFPTGELPNYMHGILNVETNSGKQLMKTPIRAENIRIGNNKTTIYYSFDLNPFIDGQKNIMNASANSLKISVVVDQLKFANGQEIKLLDSLPEV